MSDTTALPRETGSEKATVPCATCGKELPVVTTRIGSTTAGACPNCTGDAELAAEKAALAYVEEHGYPQGEPVVSWTVEQLDAYATAKEVDLTGRKGSKADRVKALQEAAGEA